MDNKSIKISSVVVLLLGVFAAFRCAVAAPIISGLSGEVSDSSQITISGSGFGLKERAQPLKWDNFNSSIAGNPVTENGWSTITATQYITPIFENDSSRVGNFARCLHQQANGVNGYQDSLFYYDGGETDLNELFITFYKRRIREAGNIETDNNKWFRIAYDARDGTGEVPCVAHTYLNENNLPGEQGGSSITGTKGYVPPEDQSAIETHWYSMPPYNKWVRWEGYYVKGNGIALDGTIREYRGDGENIFEKVVDSQQEQTDSSDLRSWHDIIFGGYCRLGNLDEGVDNSVIYYSDFDDIYIDTTQARIEMGDNADWSL